MPPADNRLNPIASVPRLNAFPFRPGTTKRACPSLPRERLCLSAYTLRPISAQLLGVPELTVEAYVRFLSNLKEAPLRQIYDLTVG